MTSPLPPLPPFNVTTTPAGDRVIVAPCGDLDPRTVGAVDDVLKKLTSEGFTSLVVDLRQVTFMDSSGLHLLLDADQTARRNGHDFAIIDGNEIVSRLMEMTGTSDLFTRFEP